MKRKSAPGAGLVDVEAAKRDLKEYGFLAWLEEHLQLRETKTNLRSIRLDDFESGSTDHSDSDDTESLNIEPDLNRARKKMKTTSICTKVSDDKPNSNCNNSKKIETVQQAELFASQSIRNAFAAKAQSASSNDKKDADDFFGEIISQELKQLSVRKKAYLKHRIQILIYESQMETSEPTNNLMPQSPVANQPNNSIYGSPLFDRNHRKHPNFGYYTNLLNG